MFVKPPHFLRALSSPNYRRYLTGQCLSLMGNWMTVTASLWLVFQLSGDPWQVGLVGFAGQIPVLIFAPFAGVWIDRRDPLKIVRMTQVFAMLQSTALAALTLSGHLTVPRLIALCFVQGLINALDWPARQTLNHPLAGDPSLLDNVIALNSITFSAARLVGPAVAGFIIAGFGAGWCYAFDALSYVGVLIALAGVRLAPHVIRPNLAHPLTDLREGVRYAMRHPALRRILIMVPVIGLVGFAHSILAPVFAERNYHGDARTLGFLMSATGIGALAAGLRLSLRASSAGLDRMITFGALLGGASLVGIAFAPSFVWALPCFAGAGAGGMLVMVSSNMLLQATVDHDKRGRVMSLFSMGQSFYPVGCLLTGAVASAFGAPVAVAVSGTICLAAAIGFGRSQAAVASAAATSAGRI
ncbi:MAG: MFS transporter [Opitutaceae bacterium]